MRFVETARRARLPSFPSVPPFILFVHMDANRRFWFRSLQLQL
jgi:hypothetical protein